jgi:hypothetical protein
MVFPFVTGRPEPVDFAGGNAKSQQSSRAASAQQAGKAAQVAAGGGVPLLKIHEASLNDFEVLDVPHPPLVPGKPPQAARVEPCQFGGQSLSKVTELFEAHPGPVNGLGVSAINLGLQPHGLLVSLARFI